MPRFVDTLIATAVIAVTLAESALAQDLRMFDTKETLDAKIAGHLEEGSFSTLVAEVAPPSRMSTGRVRILEEAYAGDIPSFQQSVRVFGSEGPETISREVTAWWADETYVFLGLLTHERTDGIAVLDFILTSDIRRASRWYLTAETR